MFDADSTLVLFNNQYLTINQYPTGFPQTSIPYRELATFAARRGDLWSGDPAALVTSQVTAIERLMRTRSGTLRQQRRLADGRVVETIVTALPTGGFAKTYEDISERVASQAERARLTEMYHAAQKTQALGTLAGGIAHDFNNIIGSIIGNCSLLISDLPPGDPGYARLRQIMDSGTRARDLVRQILTYSRNAESDRKPLALNLLIEESLATLRPLMPRNVTLQVENIEPCRISGDSTQIHQVMLNVCVNAVQAIGERQGRIKVSVQRVDVTAADLPGPGHGDVEGRGSRPGAPTRGQVGTLRDGSYARFSIIDTGSGIPEDVMPRIFEPFYTTKEVGQGTGLGLAAVQGVIRNHEGAVCIESLSGVGTRVDVYFPATELPVLVTRPEEIRPQAPAASERLLLIDDDRVLLSVTREILMRLGYTVEAHSDLEQALEVFRADPEAWDLVITDRSMPKLSGEELAGALKGLRPDIPVLMLSGYVSSEDVERLSEVGISAVVGKPILPDELATVVRDVLGQPSADAAATGTRSAGLA